MVSGDKARVTFKGLVEGFQDTPLKKFKGRLVDYDTIELTGNYPGTRVQLKFDNVEVMVSSEPYHFPIAEIGIRYSDRKNSSWGIFASSAQKIVPDCDILELVGKTILMERTPDHKFGQDRDTGEDVIRECWEVQEIEGVEAGVGIVSAADKALQLLHLKSEVDWNQAVLGDSLVKGDAALVSQILNKSFIGAMEQAGKVTKDNDGIYHVVGMESE